MFKKNKYRKKVGLALGSGGFRGPAHIGVMKSLVKNNIPIDFISGSSAGAILAAHYAIFKDLDRARDDVLRQQSRKFTYLKDVRLKDGLLSGKTVENDFLKMYKGANFSHAQIPLAIVATDLISGDPFFFLKGDVSRAVRASISIPFTFRPLKYKDKIFVDGGISCPIPDKVLRDMGADVIISVNLYNKRKTNKKNFGLSGVVNRVSEIFLVDSSIFKSEYSDFIINPDTSKYADMPRVRTYFDKKMFLEIIDLAERETDRIILDVERILS